MGLGRDIENALLDVVESAGELDNVQKNNIQKLSVNLSRAIQDFITAQTFTITQMKAILEVEELTTATPLTADALPSITVVAGGIPGPGTVVNGTKGVLIPPLALKRFGGQGGVMKTKGYAYIGNNPVNPGETGETLTKVRLLKRNVVER